MVDPMNTLIAVDDGTWRLGCGICLMDQSGSMRRRDARRVYRLLHNSDDPRTVNANAVSMYV
jgi:hypothetical protein